MHKDENAHALSDVLDALQDSIEGDHVTVEHVMHKLGNKSFAALILVFSLVSASPASAIPGITAIVGLIVALLAAQMIAGRRCPWLPGFIRHRRLAAGKVCKGIAWLRKPVHFVERFLGERLTFWLHRPWLWVPLVMVLVLGLCMPFMEVVPTSGSLASAVIALFAAGLMTRDGALVLLSFGMLLVLGTVAWRVLAG